MLKKYFDKCFVIHLVEEKQRFDIITQNYKEYGFLNDIIITAFTKIDINNIIGENLNSLHTGYYDDIKITNPYIYGNVFSCSYNFLQVIKCSYELGYKHILLMEDDSIFSLPKETIINYFENTPKDYDIVKYTHSYCTGFSGSNQFNEDKKNTQDLFIRVKQEYKLNWNGCFALSRQGMKYFIDTMSRNFVAADIPFRDIPKDFGLKYYVAKENLVKQIPRIKSTITNKNN